MSEDTEITDEAKREIRTRKIEIYRNSIYDAQLDAKIAEVIDDEEMKKAAAERIRRCLKAIDVLTALAS